MIAVGIAVIIFALTTFSRIGKQAEGVGKGIASAMKSKRSGSGLAISQPLPDFVKKVVADKSATPNDLAKASIMAADAGYPMLANSLAKRVNVEGGKVAIPSPWDDVTSAAWTRFCSVITGKHKIDYVNPRGFFGLFQMSVRRLCDLGAMSMPHSRNVREEDGQIVRIWEATWIVPKDEFFSNPRLQYEYFCKSMELYRNIVSEKYGKVIGLEVFPGRPATLSGLLAVAHQAGSEGMRKWLTNSDIRKKFSWVTTAYNTANEIF